MIPWQQQGASTRWPRLHATRPLAGGPAGSHTLGTFLLRRVQRRKSQAAASRRLDDNVLCSTASNCPIHPCGSLLTRKGVSRVAAWSLGVGRKTWGQLALCFHRRWYWRWRVSAKRGTGLGSLGVVVYGKKPALKKSERFVVDGSAAWPSSGVTWKICCTDFRTELRS